MKVSLLVLGILAFPLASQALECAKDAKLVQTDGKDNTLHSWCEANGKRNGPYEVFAVNGGLKVQAQYKDGKLDGPFKRFDAEGNPQTEGAYSNGQMSGVWTRYWSKEKIRDQGEWKNGSPVGEWRFLDPSTAAERKVTYGAKGKAEGPKDLESNWRFITGYIHTDRYGYNEPGRDGDKGYTVDLIALGVERRVVNWKRYLRLDVGARLLPEKLAQSKDVVVSGQLALSLELLRNLTGPVGLYTRLGAHFTDFDKDRFSFGLGVRYHLKRYKAGTFFSGFFAELGYVDYEDDRYRYDSSNNPGPVQSNNDDGDSGLDTFFTGVYWSVF